LVKNQRAEPEPNWMPLRQAVFTFGIAEDGRASELRDKPFYDLTEAEVVEITAIPSSLRELTSTLKEKSGAQEAKIDRARSSFSLVFVRDEGGVEMFFGPPWAAIEEPRETILNPRLGRPCFTRAHRQWQPTSSDYPQMFGLSSMSSIGRTEWLSLPTAQRIGRFTFNVPQSTYYRRMRPPLPMR
jgi:hypothetical protein